LRKPPLLLLLFRVVLLTPPRFPFLPSSISRWPLKS
jgi:hypothetical protein